MLQHKASQHYSVSFAGKESSQCPTKKYAQKKSDLTRKFYFSKRVDQNPNWTSNQHVLPKWSLSFIPNAGGGSWVPSHWWEFVLTFCCNWLTVVQGKGVADLGQV